MKPFQVFIGYDSMEVISYHVLAHSILRRASVPVSITPIALTQLKGIYERNRGPTESTEFSLSRFLVPYLSHFEGWSVFMDCDMLCLTDIAELLAEFESQSQKSVLVCQHDYEPKTATKFLGQQQTKYPRKNWSSFIAFNNYRCRALSPAYVNSATGLELHRFQWLDDSEIGSLPLVWNHLVGEYDKVASPKVIHYTLGGPWFKGFERCDYSAEWQQELKEMRRPYG